MSVETRIREKLVQALAARRGSTSSTNRICMPVTAIRRARAKAIFACSSCRPRSPASRAWIAIALVNEALAAELKGTVHALAIKAYAPGEAAN